MGDDHRWVMLDPKDLYPYKDITWGYKSIGMNYQNATSHPNVTYVMPDKERTPARLYEIFEVITEVFPTDDKTLYVYLTKDKEGNAYLKTTFDSTATSLDLNERAK